MFNGSCLGPEDWGWPPHSHHLYFVAHRLFWLGTTNSYGQSWWIRMWRNLEWQRPFLSATTLASMKTELWCWTPSTGWWGHETVSSSSAMCDVLFISLLCFTSTRTSVRSHQKNFMITSWRLAWISRAVPCVSTTGQCQSSLGISKERPSVW